MATYVALLRGVNVGKAKRVPMADLRDVLAGLSFDVECHPAAGGAAVLLTLRSDRTTWDETRQVRTSHGDIECPTLGVSRLRGRTLLPVGSTRIVGATLSNGVVTLTLVSAIAD